MVNSSEYLLPFPSKMHAPLLEAALGTACHVVIQDDASNEVVQSGLATVNNDACYSAILVAGQLVNHRRLAGISDEKEFPHVAIPNFCVHCRCEDMALLVTRALAASGEDSATLHIGTFFDLIEAIPSKAQARVAEALIVGDMLQQVWCTLLPYNQGKRREEFRARIDELSAHAISMLTSDKDILIEEMSDYIKQGVCGFIKEDGSKPLPRVGIVGTPTAVFCSDINFNLIETIADEGCVPVVPTLSSIISYSLGVLNLCASFRTCLDESASKVCPVACEAEVLWDAFPTNEQLFVGGTKVTPEQVTQGLGWALAGQMLLFWNRGIQNIIYSSTFGCLAGHIAGQGIMKRMREECPGVNLAAVEYDPGTSPVNQVNRIRLLTSIATRNADD